MQSGQVPGALQSSRSPNGPSNWPAAEVHQQHGRLVHACLEQIQVAIVVDVAGSHVEGLSDVGEVAGGRVGEAARPRC